MGEPMMDIQQQQKILQTKGQDAATQGHPFYERLSNSDKRIPRANIIGSTKGTYFAPTSSHCYVDETVRFNALERNGGTNNSVTSSTIDAKFLPLDENYKSCKSVLGSDGDKTPEMLAKSKSSTNYTKISSPASSSAVLSGPTNNIVSLNQRQLDENGNALGEIQQNSSGVGSGSLVWKQINSVSASAANASAALLNSCGNVSTSATVTISPHTASTTVSTSATVTTTLSSGPSQAKAKAKKKSQQERNTKTVDVESVAGYRGKDPVEELVKYIESSSEDKQGVGSGSKSGEKKKERKKDKEKHQKLKKSNSLEELRSGAKMEVHELKRTAATTESNTVLGRQKSGGGKQNKNNSSSTADINKNLDSKNQTQSGNSRKSDRRSWGNEDLKYLHDQQNANLTSEDKTNTAKDRRNKVSLISVSTSSKDEKETKDKTSDRNELNLTNNISSAIQNDEKPDKIEKSDKFEKIDKTDKSEKRKKQEIPPNAVTVVDIQAIESALPETAEFHVVTKKKKPKKQKVVNNLEETTVTFNRTHNFTMQKTSTFNQQQQQMTVRYKYYHHDNLNSTNTSISNSNTNSQYHQHLSSQFQQHQQQQSSNYNSNAGVTNSHHQSRQTTSDGFSNSDKSRRKSTSSVPPSEKSDSSDLDSVHSLPIESTKQTNVSNTLKEGTQLRTKDSKNNNTTLGSNNFTLCKNQNGPTPVSYADIARTNKEITDAVGTASASGILINNNEISTECRNADTTTQNANVTESFNDDKSTVVNAATGVTASTSLSKLHKIKKSQIKQDFPELVGSSVISDDKNVSTNTNHKTITYSQSLTAVKHPIQNAASVLNHGSGFNSANEASPSSSTDFNTKASPMELHKNTIVHQHIPPLQHPQQLVLQKSKSVDNDSIALTNSSSSITYMASLNCNNLDQQYPALEKTVKRHSSSNVTLNANASNYCSPSSVNTTNSATNQATFNFAAAAKQQIALSNNEQHNTTLNKNLALTTSNTNNTIQTSLQTNANSNVNTVGVNVNSGILGTAMTNKKSKEKTPPLSSNSTQLLQNASQDFNATNSIINTNITTLSTTVVTNSKKSKKERLLQQQQVLLDNTQAKQNNNNNNNNNGSSRKPSKTQLKSSTSLPLSVTTSSSTSSTLASSCANTISINRPAVIILNDDRNSTNCAANNQFTFGDFNEEELKLFDDDNNVTENTLETINTNTISSEEEKHQRTVTNAVTNTQSMSYFNDSGTSCASDTTNNSTSDMLLSSSMEASSPNTSFATISHTVSGGVNNLEPPPPPQQLETCNDIETAIIAAARAAAKHQQPAHHQLQQQQQYKNSNASSSSSSFSSSSLTSSTSSACHNYNQHHNNNNIKRNYPNQIGSGNVLPSTYPHQSQQQQYEEDYEDDNESYINMPRSRSPSRPRRISIAGGTVANKEFDIHFIPPTTMPTAFSTQQHNDIIIDFIGSAWEEVANSKVTKVYDGQ
ncbi:hypothetical protein DOY81_007880 [Sarcophaga bullata]|nr:hypothetical protein DOY81_007880 [Sarcophaga bullata]